MKELGSEVILVEETGEKINLVEIITKLKVRCHNDDCKAMGSIAKIYEHDKKCKLNREVKFFNNSYRA